MSGNEAVALDPSLTDGCEATVLVCKFYTPYALAAGTRDLIAKAFWNKADPREDIMGEKTFSISFDLSTKDSSVWAVWTPIAPVLLPASLPLMAVGLAGLAGLRMRKKRASLG